MADDQILRCVVERRDGAVVITAAGDLVAAAVEALESAVQQALSRVPELVVLDFAQVQFCDSTGLALLIRMLERIERAGSHLRIAHPSPPVTRLFAVTGLDSVLDIAPAMDA
jgi:anti-anti-sigma factor